MKDNLGPGNANQARQQPAAKPAAKLEGKSFQVNDRSVETKNETHPPAVDPRGTTPKSDEDKLRGKSLQVNENSLKTEDADQ